MIASIQPESAHEKTQSKNSGRATIRVVIVEDYNLTRIGIRSFLNKYDTIKVIGEAENAEKGIEFIRQERPDVVLMDLGLPGMNGIEATQLIKAFDDTIKVIVLTSHEREEEVISALGAGANAYCLKDIDSAKLAHTIESVADGGAYLDPAVASIALKLCPQATDTAYSQANCDGQNQLTDKELDVLKLLVEGLSNTEIANQLVVSVHTAKAHVCNILQKLTVNDRVQAAVKAIREGIV